MDREEEVEGGKEEQEHKKEVLTEWSKVTASVYWWGDTYSSNVTLWGKIIKIITLLIHIQLWGWPNVTIHTTNGTVLRALQRWKRFNHSVFAYLGWRCPTQPLLMALMEGRVYNATVRVQTVESVRPAFNSSLVSYLRNDWGQRELLYLSKLLSFMKFGQ